MDSPLADRDCCALTRLHASLRPPATRASATLGPARPPTRTRDVSAAATDGSLARRTGVSCAHAPGARRPSRRRQPCDVRPALLSVLLCPGRSDGQGSTHSTIDRAARSTSWTAGRRAARTALPSSTTASCPSLPSRRAACRSSSSIATVRRSALRSRLRGADGRSFPVTNLSTHNLRFLTTEQHLEDGAYFVRNVNISGVGPIAHSPVIWCARAPRNAG